MFIGDSSSVIFYSPADTVLAICEVSAGSIGFIRSISETKTDCISWIGVEIGKQEIEVQDIYINKTDLLNYGFAAET